MIQINVIQKYLHLPAKLLIITYLSVAFTIGEAKEGTSQTLNNKSEVTLYYDILNDHGISAKDKSEQWKRIYQSLEGKEDFNLKAMLLYQLANVYADLRMEKETNRWLLLLTEHNSERKDAVAQFLIEKVKLKKLAIKHDYLQVIDLASSLLSRANSLPMKSEEGMPDQALMLTTLDVTDLINSLGKAYYFTGEYEKAQKYFFDALKGYESIGDKQGVSKLFNNLSAISWAQNDIEKAMEYLDKGLDISRELGDERAIISKLSNKGIYYNELNKTELAQTTFESALNNPNAHQHPDLLINTLLALSDTYIVLQKNDLAEEKVVEALTLSRKIDDSFNIANSMMALANFRMRQNDLENAISLMLSAINYYNEKSLKKESSKAYLDLSRAYKKSGDLENAYLYFEKYHEKNAELEADAQKQSVKELQEKYDSNVKKKQIELLTKENRLKEVELESERSQTVNIQIYGVSLFVISLLIIGRYFQHAEAKRLKRYTKEIEMREEKLLLLSNAFKNTSDAVWIANEYFEIEVVNEAFEKMTNNLQAVGQKVSFADVEGQGAEVAEYIFEQASEVGQWEGELFDQKHSGEVFPLEMKVEAIRNEENKLTHFLGVFRDISHRKKIQEQLARFATHDDLTGLPNRTLLSELIQRSCMGFNRGEFTPALLFVDVDGFKKVNDSLGLEVGDSLIKAVAERLTNTVRSKDVVARIGGDEFCLLLELNGPKITAANIATKVLNVFEKAYLIGNRSLKISASIGISIYPDDANTPEELIRKSDLAMNVAKQSGGNAFNFYKSHMNDEVVSLLEFEQKLVNAIDNQYFVFYYQPIVDIKSSEIVGAEALIRWQEPDGELIYPDQFIPYSEKTGLIERIDVIVIDKVFSQLANWNERCIAISHVSLNLSARIFAQADKLISLLQRKLNTYSVNAEQIKVEITEGMLIDNIEQVIDTMHRIKALGFVLAIDDFGTGFSSLNYLKQFPIDVLKVDRTFIMDIHKSEKNKRLVQSIIDLAHNLNFSVIAEGVEEESHLQALSEMGCEEYQGYYFSRPIDVVAFEELFLS